MPYAHITCQERVTLACLLKHQNSVQEISRVLGKHRSTIYREIRRNSRPGSNTTRRVNRPRALALDGRHYRGQAMVDDIRDRRWRYYERVKQFESRKPRYDGHRAEQRHGARQLAAKDNRRKAHQSEYAESFELTTTLITKRTSPGQVASRLRRLGLPYLSDNVIYAYITRDNPALTRHLRRRGKQPRRHVKTAYNQTGGKRPIHARPAAVDDLSRVGDLEGDTIVGSDKRDRIVTHVDRKTGLASLSLVLGYDSDKVRQATGGDVARLFGGAYTITYNNGNEFAAWKRLEQDITAEIYFADAYRSSQRGRNENLNGLIRDFIPKGSDFKKLTRQYILELETILNTRPRIRLDGLTPEEAYASELRSRSVAVVG